MNTAAMQTSNILKQLVPCCIDCKTRIVRDEVAHIMFRLSKGDKGAKRREVVYDSLSQFAWCWCSRFESDGIPCPGVLCWVVVLPS